MTFGRGKTLDKLLGKQMAKNTDKKTKKKLNPDDIFQNRDFKFSTFANNIIYCQCSSKSMSN